ncbi:MAG: class II fructose-bisphosphate aldolase [Fidelibacterota bacterium]
MSKQYLQPPELNTDRKFPDNMMSGHSILAKAKRGEKWNSKGETYAVPAFNVTTFQGINASFEAFETLGASGLLAFSNSALKHFGRGDAIEGLEIASNYVEILAKKSTVRVATHLDHGDYMSDGGRKVIQGAVQMLTSVMADNSTNKSLGKPTSLADNIGFTREVVDLAHPVGVSVEGELGVLAGVEDEDTQSEESTYTNPEELERFLRETGVLMLAPTIGTKHGPNKGKPGEKVKLNIPLAHKLLKIANAIHEEIVFVAHGASTLYPNIVEYAVSQLSELGEKKEEILNWQQFVGTDWDQIQGLIGAGFCKINTDTENRQTYLASLIGAINKTASKVDIRYYDKVTTQALTKSYIQKLIMAGDYGVWHDPKIDINNFKFEL